MEQTTRRRSQRFSRAKTGCFTCRARRKKCDEERDPYTGGCGRCRRSGVECLGFPDLRNAPLSAHTKRLKVSETASSSRAVSEGVGVANQDDESSISTGADNDAVDESFLRTIIEAGNGEDDDPTTHDDSLEVLSSLYSRVSWYWWKTERRDERSLSKLVQALESRRIRSDIVCTTMAAVCACYGQSDSLELSRSDSEICREFRGRWTELLETILQTRVSRLYAFSDWLKATAGDGTPSSAETSTQDPLLDAASKVLRQISSMACQDQELPTDLASPLEYSALIHVDTYLHAAMDLAFVAFVKGTCKAFIAELESTASLLESLLGYGRSVNLSEVDGISVVGFRMFVWADILNAVVSCRSTRLHYLLDKDAEDSCRHVTISFGCPDNILAVFASASNLHFSLLQCRRTGALSKHPSRDALPAWAIHVSLDLESRIEATRSRKEKKWPLSELWCDAAQLFLQTAIHRIGPLSPNNQSRMRSIMDSWRTARPPPTAVSCGNSALPLLLAAFVAIWPSDREELRNALRLVGRAQRAREGYLTFLEKLWKKTDESGVGVLWQDIVEVEEHPMVIF